MPKYLDKDGLEEFFDDIKDLVHGPSYSQVSNWMDAHPDVLSSAIATDVTDATDNWLDEHPEATTSVLDGSISFNKLADAARKGYVRNFETVADMQAATDLKAGITCHTNGFHSAGDEGGAHYLISSDGEDDGMSVIKCGELYAYLIAGDVITPQMLGAYGDSIHDDTDIIQAAIDMPVNVLRIPSGTYMVTKTLLPRSNMNMIGDDRYNSVIKFYFPSFEETHIGYYGVVFTEHKNITFENIKFDGQESNFHAPTPSPNGAFHIFYFKPTADNDVSNITIDNCIFTRSYDCAIASYGTAGVAYPHPITSHIRISNCKFEEIGVHGIGMNEWEYSEVTNCEFINVGLKDIYDGYGSGIAVDVSGGCSHVIVKGNMVNGASGGFKAETHTQGDVFVATKNVVFADNIIKNLYDKSMLFFGIRVNGENIHVANNVIESYMHGIQLGTSAKNCVISNNSVTANAPGAHGIRADINFGGHVINGNRVYSCTADGIYSASDNTTIINNTVSGCTNGIRIYDCKNIECSNNMCFDNKTTGLFVTRINGTIENIVLVGNIAYDTRADADRVQQRGIVISNDCINARTSGNLAYNNVTTQFFAPALEVSTVNDAHGIYYSHTVPTDGTWERGTIIIDPLPATNSPWGWICVVSGTPGTWRILGIATS